MTDFAIGSFYTRDEIHAVLGGNKQHYLPTHRARVVCGAFTREANPDAPFIVLPGFGPIIERSAEVFARHGAAVPIFIKRAVNRWEYVGNFAVERVSKAAVDVAREERRANRPGGISMVLYLQASG